MTTYQEIQARRDHQDTVRIAARIEKQQRELRRSLDVLQDPSLPNRELNERILRYSAAERAAGRKIDYALARQQVLHNQDRPKPGAKRPTTRQGIVSTAMAYAAAERAAGRPCSFEQARQHVLAN